ncbi:MAG: beta-N-acetylhexosaminidase [Gammaproteobacteria bacterium]|nr:beta-N-acetylhexosaminidase [Gammaproteobacteria bacterium]
MSLGPVMCDIKGLTLSDSDRVRLCKKQVGGVILFTRNYESPQQIKALIDDIHQLRTPRLIVAVDHEGGRVQRFRAGFESIPAMRVFGKIFDQNEQKAINQTETIGWLVASELLHYGLDLSFAPVLDIGDPVSEVIGDRAFHKDPKVITRLANAWIRGMRAAGMEAVGKHFPGHGSVQGDSHHVMPFDNRSYEQIQQLDLIPFAQVIKTHLSGVMMAHVIYEQVDTLAAGFSKFWIGKCLRQILNFDGVVFSDDLSMAGAESAGSYAQRAFKSLEAGCDMLIVCNNEDGADEVIEALGEYNNPVSQIRLTRLHGKKPQKNVFETKQWKHAKQVLEQLNAESSLTVENDLF